MKKAVIIVLLLMQAPLLFAQERVNSMGEAKEKASSEGKSILLVFAGSDWCIPCIKLEKQIWSSDKFKELARKDFVMLKADFPRREKNKLPEEKRKRNKQLADKYNPKGYFPLVVVLNSKGDVLGKTGYKKDLSPKEYYKHLKSFIDKQ